MAKRKPPASGIFVAAGSAAALRHLPAAVPEGDSVLNLNCEAPLGDNATGQAISIMLAEEGASVIQRQREEIERHKMTSEDIRN
eukprot:3379896-Karenia_brevis.AAC.1